MKFLFVILGAMALEAGLAFVAVTFVEAVWARAIILAIVPLGLILAVTFGDRE